MSFLRNVSSVASWTVLSRIAGYLRDLVLANFIGVNILSDAITLAIKLPAFFRRLFAEGAFHVSFLPVFSGLMGSKTEPTKKSFDFASQAFSWLLLSLLTLILLIEWQMPLFVNALFSGLRHKPETLQLVIRLARITFPYILMISLTSFFGSLLNASGRFAFLAASHALWSLGTIAWFLCFVSSSKDYGGLYAWGILLAGALQLFCVFGLCWYYKLRIRIVWPRLSPSMKEFFQRLGPGLLGVGVLHVNMIIGFYFSSRLKTGGVSYVYYADRLNQLPLSIIAISLSTVLLPVLVRHIHAGHTFLADKTQNHALRFAMALVCPFMMFSLCLSLPISSLLFGHGRLLAQDVAEIARTISAFSLGFPAYIIIKIMNTRCFAEGEMRVPLYASGVGVLADITFSFLLTPVFAHVGIALAISASAWIQASFLMISLFRRHAWRLNITTRRFLRRISIAFVGSGSALIGIQAALPSFSTLSLWQQIGLLFLLIIFGLAVWGGLCWWFRAFSSRHFQLLWRSVRPRSVRPA